jgi:hypothetical protein
MEYHRNYNWLKAECINIKIKKITKAKNKSKIRNRIAQSELNYP